MPSHLQSISLRRASEASTPAQKVCGALLPYAEFVLGMSDDETDSNEDSYEDRESARRRRLRSERGPIPPGWGARPRGARKNPTSARAFALAGEATASRTGDASAPGRWRVWSAGRVWGQGTSCARRAGRLG
ncbi:hypothetical protein B0H14DRAFT_2609785 [Mycena olivaceomarginata]|nr:hypothetical protein B0H14DRAFT_2609785 [Mycena olivaceomarginata]